MGKALLFSAHTGITHAMHAFDFDFFGWVLWSSTALPPSECIFAAALFPDVAKDPLWASFRSTHTEAD